MKTKHLCFLVSICLMLVLAIIPVSAAPSSAPATDGDGLMSVSPTSVTYGSSGNTLIFTFTANNDFPTGSSVEIIIPAGWTTPTLGPGAGNITWSPGTCLLNGGPPVSIAPPSTVIIDIERCLTNETFTVTYSGVTPGSIASSPYTFWTYTDIPGGGGLFPIKAGSPTVSIDPKPLTVSSTGLTPANKTYDGNTNASLTIGSPSLVGVIGGDVVSLVTEGATGTFSDRHAGLGKVVYIEGLTLSGAQAGNYTLVQPTRTANITPRLVVILAVTDIKVYDGTTSSNEIPMVSAGTPLVAGDTATGLTQSFDNKHVGTNKVITPAGLIEDGNNGSNYAYTYSTTTTGDVTKRPIIVSAVTSSKIYDGTVISGGIPTRSAGTPPAGGDIEPVWTQVFDTPNVGTGKLLIPSGVIDDGNGGNNYAYTFVTNATGEIGLRSVTITAQAKQKIIGTADPILTFDVTNGSLAPGDTLTLTRAPGESLGSYPITVGSFPAGSNYNLTYNGASLSILPPPVFKSAGALDGWVLESRRDSSVGGSVNSGAATFQLGDDVLNRQYRAILSFNTSSLPDHAIVTKAVIKIKSSGLPTGLNPFNSLGGLLVDIRNGPFGTNALTATDFQALPSVIKVGTFSKTPVNGWYSVTINLAGKGSINTKGITQFRLYFAKGDNNNLKADFMKFFSGNSTINKPELTITYTLP